MSENFRQRILNWICSALLILCFAAVSLAFHWFHVSPQGSGNSASQNFAFLFQLAETLLASMFLLPIALIWHFCDLMRPPPSKSSIWIKLFLLYPSWFVVVAVTSFFGFLLVSQVIQDPCARGSRMGHGWCEPGPPDWIVAAFFIALFIALAMCVAKILLTVLLQRSRTP